MQDLLAALALVAIIEGLILFAVPGGWKRTMLQLAEMPETGIRRYGGFVLITGLIALWLVRGG